MRALSSASRSCSSSSLRTRFTEHPLSTRAACASSTLSRSERANFVLTHCPAVEPPWLVDIYYSASSMSDQASNAENNVELPIAKHLRLAIGMSIQNEKEVEQILDAVLRTLDQQRLIHYARKNQVQLLNQHGRVLIAILEDPGITQRALSVYLSTSESNINNSIKLLLKNNIITKTKVSNKNTYAFNLQEGLSHPDISRFLDTLLPIVKQYMNNTK